MVQFPFCLALSRFIESINIRRCSNNLYTEQFHEYPFFMIHENQ